MSTGIDTPPDDSVQACAIPLDLTQSVTPQDLVTQTVTGRDASRANLTQPLSQEKCIQVFEALEDGATLREAAKAAGCSHSAAWRILRTYEANLDSAKKYLATKSAHAAEAWVRATDIAAGKGNHIPAKELLLHNGSLEPLQDASSAKVNIAILIGTPEQPIRVMSPQTIDSKAVSVDEP